MQTLLERMGPTAGPAAAAASGSGSSRLSSLQAELEQTCTSFLEPAAFFVSWQGVLTLAYRGFTEALVDLKQRITAAHPGLPPENPGSKWPKTSLGCLKEGQRLTPEQLQKLCQICSEESSAAFRTGPQAEAAAEAAATTATTNESSDGGIRLAVDSAEVVLFECRSLERLLSCQHVNFQGSVDEGPASVEEQARVAGILAEPSAPGYWFAASRDGNREGHYRGTHLGATLIHTLLVGGGHAGEATHAARPGLAARGVAELKDRRALLAAVDRFRRRVDAELPGLYAWFDDASLHITIRALIN